MRSSRSPYRSTMCANASSSPHKQRDTSSVWHATSAGTYSKCWPCLGNSSSKILTPLMISWVGIRHSIYHAATCSSQAKHQQIKGTGLHCNISCFSNIHPRRHPHHNKVIFSTFEKCFHIFDHFPKKLMSICCIRTNIAGNDEKSQRNLKCTPATIRRSENVRIDAFRTKLIHVLYYSSCRALSLE